MRGVICGLSIGRPGPAHRFARAGYSEFCVSGRTLKDRIHVNGRSPCPSCFANGLRYFFFSNEGQPPESPHIHVKGGGRDAKVWIELDVLLADSYGFNPRELSTILRTVAANAH